MNNLDYSRLSYLGDKVRAGNASKVEKDEFMSILYNDGKISPVQYNDYISNRNVENIINTALAVGAVLLIGYLLSEVIKG